MKNAAFVTLLAISLCVTTPVFADLDAGIQPVTASLVLNQEQAAPGSTIQAAVKLTCKLSTVYALVAASEIGYYRVGRGKGIRISDEQIEEFLQKRRGGGGDPPPAKPKSAQAAQFTMLDGERLKKAWQKQ